MIRVLVVDDSPVVRELLVHILDAAPGMKVVGTAADGQQAIEAARELKPDVITMDIYMPHMDGLQATRTIMETDPVPVVIVSASYESKEVSKAFKCVEAGALAVIGKPLGLAHPDYGATARQLVNTVRAMSEVRVVRRWPPRGSTEATLPTRPCPGEDAHAPIKAVTIGASTGGPAALHAILV